MRAASFGKLALDENKQGHARLNEFFLNTCQMLRVLATVSNGDRQGMCWPLTAPEYYLLTPSAIVQRIAHKKKHFLALRISRFLHTPPGPILLHWACMTLNAAQVQAERRAERAGLMDKNGGMVGGMVG